LFDLHPIEVAKDKGNAQSFSRKHVPSTGAARRNAAGRPA